MSIFRRVFALFSLLLCAHAGAALPALPAPAAGELSVYFLDVGQGDAALIVSPTGKTVLVDGGPPDGGVLSRRLQRLLDRPIDLVVLSHPHLDHLGGLSEVLDAPGARRYMDPGFDHPTSAYRDLLRKVGAKGIPLLEPEVGEEAGPFTLDIGGGAKLTVLWPRRPKETFLAGTRSDANANSIVMRLDHGQTSFLFTGDAEADTESRLLRSGQKLSATVLKAAHHGSRHSSQAPFLRRVSPKHVVVSCGRDNAYRHPHEHALRRFRSVNAQVHRTDLEGDVLAVSDGVTVRVGTATTGVATTAVSREPRASREEVQEVAVVRVATPASEGGTRFAASRRSKVFHKEDCGTVKRIAEHNLVWFDSREEAASSKKPSGDCQP